MSAIEAIARLAAELPDPGHPSFTTICAGLGGFVGGLVARARPRWRADVPRRVADGIFLGFGAGLVCWLVALAIDRL